MSRQKDLYTGQCLIVTERRHSKDVETPVVMAASCHPLSKPSKLGARGSRGAGDEQRASETPHNSHEGNGRRRLNGMTEKEMNGEVAATRELPARPQASVPRIPTCTHETREQPSAAAECVCGVRRETDAIQTRFADSRTTPIIRLLFHSTLSQANLDKEVIRKLDIEQSLRSLAQKDVTFVHETCDRYLEYIRNSESVSVDSHLRGIETAGWDVSDNNVYVEFKKVVNETFDESVTWGGVIGFLGFALGFSVFIYNKGMRRAVISVAEWTKQVIEDDIGTFFLRNNGWEGFRERVETLLRRQRRTQRANNPSGAGSEPPSFWQNAIAATTIAAGAAVLLGLRQAFS